MKNWEVGLPGYTWKCVTVFQIKVNIGLSLTELIGPKAGWNAWCYWQVLSLSCYNWHFPELTAINHGFGWIIVGVKARSQRSIQRDGYVAYSDYGILIYNSDVNQFLYQPLLTALAMMNRGIQQLTFKIILKLFWWLCFDI